MNMHTIPGAPAQSVLLMRARFNLVQLAYEGEFNRAEWLELIEQLDASALILSAADMRRRYDYFCNLSTELELSQSLHLNQVRLPELEQAI